MHLCQQACDYLGVVSRWRLGFTGWLRLSAEFGEGQLSPPRRSLLAPSSWASISFGYVANALVDDLVGAVANRAIIVS